LLNDILPLCDKIDGNDQTKHDRGLQLKRVVEHVTEEGTELTVLGVLSVDAIQDYCEACAPHSLDSYGKMALCFHRLVAQAQGETDMPVAVCREMSALESMIADFEHSKRSKAKPPPPMMAFVGPAHSMFEKVSTEHADMAYVDLAKAVWFLFTVLAVATRTRTLLTARWGENVSRDDRGDWSIRLGNPAGGTKHQFPLSVRLSELKNLCHAGILYPDLAATALDWLYGRTKGDKNGRLVFSRSDSKDSVFGKSVFGAYMREQYKGNKEMDCGALRKRIEITASQLADAGRITLADRALVSNLLQHKAQTAALDYLPAGDTEPEPSPGGSVASDGPENAESENAESAETSPESLVAHNGDVIEIVEQTRVCSMWSVTCIKTATCYYCIYSLINNKCNLY
jgi:hypothetical protein